MKNIHFTGFEKALLAIITIVALVFAIKFGSDLVDRIPQNDIEEQVYTFEDKFEPCWKLKYADYDGENTEQIRIVFENQNSSDEEGFESMKATYESVANTFLTNPDSNYRDKSFVLFFTYGKFDGFMIDNIDKNRDQVLFIANHYISADDIVHYFPEITRIGGVSYMDIQEFDVFRNLEYIYFSRELTQEEKEYLMTRFPNCELDIRNN